MGLFRFWNKRKKKEVAPIRKDYQDLKIVLNMKTLLLYEQMGKKSFYTITEEDFTTLIYCSLVINNDIKMTLKRFKLVMTNEKIANVLVKKCAEELDFITQFGAKDKETGCENADGAGYISDVINTLILQYNVDINYVMNEMKLWELAPMAKAMEQKSKADMTEKRFWTYMQILPHIDGKKIKSPEKLLPFPWEKEQQKQDSIRFMEENKEAIKAFFQKAKEKTQENE